MLKENVRTIHNGIAGFGIIQILIIAAVTSLIMVSLLSTTTVTNFNQRELGRALNWSDLQTVILDNLRHPQGCLNTLGGVALSTTPQPIAKVFAPLAITPHIVATGSNLGYPPAVGLSGPAIINYGSGGAGELLNVNFYLTVPQGVPIAPNSSLTANITVTFDQVTQNSATKLRITKPSVNESPIVVNILTNGASGIANCYADNTFSETAECGFLGGTWNPATLTCQSLSFGNNLPANSAALTLPSGSFMMQDPNAYVQIGPNPPPFPPPPSTICDSAGCLSLAAAPIPNTCPRPLPALQQCTNVIGISSTGQVICGSLLPLPPPTYNCSCPATGVNTPASPTNLTGSVCNCTRQCTRFFSGRCVTWGCVLGCAVWGPPTCSRRCGRNGSRCCAWGSSCLVPIPPSYWSCTQNPSGC